MRNLEELKTIAEQMFELSAKLLRLVDRDETERKSFIEQVKKIGMEKYYNFLMS